MFGFKDANSKTEEEETTKTHKSNDYWNKQLADFVQTLKSSSSQMGSVSDPLNMLRKEIIDTFQELLLGDTLAAEYLLMHLLSSV